MTTHVLLEGDTLHIMHKLLLMVLSGYKFIETHFSGLSIVIQDHRYRMITVSQILAKFWILSFTDTGKHLFCLETGVYAGVLGTGEQVILILYENSVHLHSHFPHQWTIHSLL